MIELFLTFLSLAALRFAWGAWKNIQRDMVRDKLFDLRDEWREIFIKNGLSMDMPEYAKVRDYLNAYLRYTARFRLVGLFYMAWSFPRGLERATALRLDHELHSDNEMLAGEISRIRAVAAVSVQKYMIVTSLLVFPLAISAVVAVSVSRARKSLGATKSKAKEMVDKIPALSEKSIEFAAAA